MKNVICPECGHTLAIEDDDGYVSDPQGCGYTNRPEPEQPEIPTDGS